MAQTYKPIAESRKKVCTSCIHSTNPVLTGIKIDHLAILEDGRTSLQFKAGELIYKMGMQPAGLLCLNKGKVMIVQKDDQDNQVVTHLVKEVSFLGLADFYAGQSYRADAIALEDCRVCIIRKEKASQLLSTNTFFVKRVISEISDQLYEANDRLLILTKKQMRARLADSLLLLIKTFGFKPDGKTIDVYLRRKDMASLCNMNVANVIRHLSTFQQENIVHLKGKTIQVEDVKVLEDISLT